MKTAMSQKPEVRSQGLERRTPNAERRTPSFSDPRNIHSHARTILVEQIMALIGRGSSDPRQYRRTLESFEIETLRRTLEELISPYGQGTDFSAPQETTDDIHRAIRRTGASTPARETLQSATINSSLATCHPSLSP